MQIIWARGWEQSGCYNSDQHKNSPTPTVQRLLSVYELFPISISTQICTFCQMFSKSPFTVSESGSTVGTLPGICVIILELLALRDANIIRGVIVKHAMRRIVTSCDICTITESLLRRESASNSLWTANQCAPTCWTAVYSSYAHLYPLWLTSLSIQTTLTMARIIHLSRSINLFHSTHFNLSNVSKAQMSLWSFHRFHNQICSVLKFYFT